MIFVVEHVTNGHTLIDVVHGDELNTDAYDHVNKIFFCESDVEAQLVVGELRNYGCE
jgi:hypothetical protein